MNRIRLDGARIALREWNSSDLDAMFRQMGDADVVRYLSWGRLTRAQCRERLRGFIADQHNCSNRPWPRRLGKSRILRAIRRRILTRKNGSPAGCVGGARCNRERYHLAVELKASGSVIGEAGFEWKAERRAEIGYFFEAKFWGLGYATEAARLVIEFAFNTLNADEVVASCDARNLASARVMLKCGLKTIDSDIHDSPIIMSLSRQEWLNPSEAPTPAHR